MSSTPIGSVQRSDASTTERPPLPTPVGRLHRFRRAALSRGPLATAAWLIVAAMILLAVFAPALAPYDPVATSSEQTLAPPLTGGHPAGTDGFGRDQLSRLLYGARPLITTSLVAVLLAVGLGFVIGLLAGYIGGATETALMRTMDAVLSFPLILLAIMIVAALGPGLRNSILAIAISQVPVFARLVRALTTREMRKEYVLAARATGQRPSRIALLEVAPNVLGPVTVQATSAIAVAAGYSAALSYLGLGIQPPIPDWGYMVKEGQEFLFLAPTLAVVPGLLITVFVTAANFVGDDLRDLVDPDRAR